MLSSCQTASNQKAGMNHGTSGASFHNLLFQYCSILYPSLRHSDDKNADFKLCQLRKA